VTAAVLSGGTCAIALGATLLAVLVVFRAKGSRRVLLAAAIVICLAGGAIASSTPAARSAANTSSASPADGELVAAINAFRAKAGRPAFKPSPALMALALEHAQDMLAKGFFGHDGPGGKKGEDRLDAFYGREGYDTVYGEDVGMLIGPADAASFVTAWAADPVHREIMLGPKNDPLYSNVGVAVLSVDSAPGVYASLGAVSVAVTEFGPPQPVLGQSVVAAPVSGVVLVRKTGSKSFIPLAAGAIVDAGTEIDATRGRVTLTSAADDAGNLQSADFYGGQFLVSYAKDTAPTPPGSPSQVLLTDLRLTGSLAGCTTPGKTRKPSSVRLPAGKAPPKKPTSRALWGNGEGRFRTENDYAAATVRGTIWLTSESCTSTVVKVLRGTVDVFDIKRKLHRSVTAGKSAVVRKSK
jgi:uncharacterized protein YkwD